VHAAAPERLIGSVAPVRLLRAERNSLAGEVVRRGEEVLA
jgi:hypothetical protein